jgi:hypothetical protein
VNARGHRKYVTRFSGNLPHSEEIVSTWQCRSTIEVGIAMTVARDLTARPHGAIGRGSSHQTPNGVDQIIEDAGAPYGTRTRVTAVKETVMRLSATTTVFRNSISIG